MIRNGSLKKKPCKNKKRKVKAHELIESFKQFKTIENRKCSFLEVNSV